MDSFRSSFRGSIGFRVPLNLRDSYGFFKGFL